MNPNEDKIPQWAKASAERRSLLKAQFRNEQAKIRPEIRRELLESSKAAETAAVTNSGDWFSYSRVAMIPLRIAIGVTILLVAAAMDLRIANLPFQYGPDLGDRQNPAADYDWVERLKPESKAWFAEKVAHEPATYQLSGKNGWVRYPGCIGIRLTDEESYRQKFLLRGDCKRYHDLSPFWFFVTNHALAATLSLVMGVIAICALIGAKNTLVLSVQLAVTALYFVLFVLAAVIAMMIGRAVLDRVRKVFGRG